MPQIQLQTPVTRTTTIFHHQLEHTRLITQLSIFAQRCELLKLHALAAHAFRKLMGMDTQRRPQHLAHFLYNAREARGTVRGGNLVCSQN
jgi:hypothetical protein